MPQFHEQHKHHITAWIILLGVTLVSGYFAYGKPHAPQFQETIPTPTTSAEQSPEPTVPTYIKQTVVNPTTTPANIISSNDISVALVVDNERSDAQVKKDSTVYDLMQQLANKKELDVTFRNYGSDLGYLVDSLNGIRGSQVAHKFWIYYINGQKAHIGISTYHLQPNDIITWKYEDDSNQ